MAHRSRSRSVARFAFVLVCSFLVADVSFARTIIVQRRPPINQYCPIDNVDFDLTFVAVQPFANVSFQVSNTTSGGTWIQNRLDNIAVIDKASYDAHHVTTPGFGTCYAAPGDPNAPALDFNASGTPERYLTRFDVNASGWDLNGGALFQSGSSAPRDPALGADVTGGHLALGGFGDGNITVAAAIQIPNLTPGTQYVITGWWYAKDTSRPLTITIDTEPCADVDLDGVSDCAGDCGNQDVKTKPGATELCDGVDNDCDGQVDEGASCDRTCDEMQLLPTQGTRLSSTSVGSTMKSLLWTGNRFTTIFQDATNYYAPFMAHASASGSVIGTARPLIESLQNSFVSHATWTGSEIAVISTGLRRFDRDGRPIGSPVAGGGSDLIWTGKEYGVVTGTSSGVAFQRLSADGTPLSGVVTLPGTSPSVTTARLAWNGTHYGVVWDNGSTVKFKRINPLSIASGSVIDIGTTQGTALAPVIAAGDGTFGIAWSDRRDGPEAEIYFCRISAGGGRLGGDVRVTNAAGWSVDPTIAWSGAEWGIAWDDTRTGNEEIWFARMDTASTKLGSELQVSNAAGHSHFPSIVWAGGKFGVAWSDDRDGTNDEIYFASIGCDCVDGDGDGSSSCEDCADADASIYPGAPSPCNGATNLDCNSAYWPLPAPTADLDGDGLSPCGGDCDDATSSIFPGAPELCDGLNNDCNSPTWPSTFGTDNADLDNDGTRVCQNDCNDANATIWATPSEVQQVNLSRSQATGYSWIHVTFGPSMPGASSVRYDYLRSEIAWDFSSVNCIEANGDAAGGPDPDIPVPGAVFFYLVRARNGCPDGLGPLGSGSDGVPRAATGCP